MVFITTRQAAEVLRIDRTTVRHLCRSGEIRAVKAGRQWRIYREDFENKYQLR